MQTRLVHLQNPPSIRSVGLHGPKADSAHLLTKMWMSYVFCPLGIIQLQAHTDGEMRGFLTFSDQSSYLTQAKKICAIKGHNYSSRRNVAEAEERKLRLSNVLNVKHWENGIKHIVGYLY